MAVFINRESFSGCPWNKSPTTGVCNRAPDFWKFLCVCTYIHIRVCSCVCMHVYVRISGPIGKITGPFPLKRGF